MTEDEMMLLNQIKQQNENLQRKSSRRGGCGSTIGGFLLLIIILNYWDGQDLKTLLFGSEEKTTTEQVDNSSNDAGNNGYTAQVATNNSTANFNSSESLIEKNKQSQIKYDKTNSIAITNLQLYHPEEDGDVPFEIQVMNTSHKTIQKVSCIVTFLDYNRKPIVNQATEQMYVNAVLTGTFEPGESNGETWKNIFYNENASYIYIVKVSILYTDGSSIVIDNVKNCGAS